MDGGFALDDITFYPGACQSEYSKLASSHSFTRTFARHKSQTGTLFTFSTVYAIDFTFSSLSLVSLSPSPSLITPSFILILCTEIPRHKKE